MDARGHARAGWRLGHLSPMRAGIAQSNDARERALPRVLNHRL